MPALLPVPCPDWLHARPATPHLPLLGCSKELILQLIGTVNTAAALEALPLVATSPDMCAAAIRALTERRSLRGVHAMLHHARSTRAAQGLEGREVWRAAIVAFGKLRRLQDARQAFVGMRAAGAWGVEDTATVNLLLNSLAWDIKLQFVRWACCCPS